VVAILKLGAQIDRVQLYKVFAGLGYLKSKPQLTSNFIERENHDLFTKMCGYLGPKDAQTFETSHAREFFFALNHLWGEWLHPEQLTSKLNRPDKMF
jgi:hypothetical protein